MGLGGHGTKCVGEIGRGAFHQSVNALNEPPLVGVLDVDEPAGVGLVLGQESDSLLLVLQAA